MSHPTTNFEKWRPSIEAATSISGLMLVVQAYLGAWTPYQAARIPGVLAAPVRGSDDLQIRATDLRVAERDFQGSPEDHALLRELCLTICAAATRMRHLKEARLH